MSEAERKGTGAIGAGLPGLGDILARWRAGDHGPFVRWVTREVDRHGGLHGREPKAAWALIEALGAGTDEEAAQLPEPTRGRLGAMVDLAVRLHAEELVGVGGQGGMARSAGRWARRFGRADTAALCRDLAAGAAGIGRAVRRQPAAVAHPERVMAALRDSWARPLDALRIEQDVGATCWLWVGGRRRLGPGWRCEGIDVAASAAVAGGPPPKWRTWSSGPVAHLAEWTFAAGPAHVERVAVWLRDRGLLVLGEQVEGGGAAAATAWDLAPGQLARPQARRSGLAIGDGRRWPLRLWPLGLDTHSGGRGDGTLEAGGGVIRVTGRSAGGRSWLPLLASWDPARNRSGVTWSPLTISERHAACPPGVAWACRIATRRDTSLIVYRSLAEPVRRAFLGHQTSARFLVGEMARDGVLRPLISLD